MEKIKLTLPNYELSIDVGEESVIVSVKNSDGSDLGKYEFVSKAESNDLETDKTPEQEAVSGMSGGEMQVEKVMTFSEFISEK